MIDKECIDEAIRALKGFSDTELKDYAKDVMAKAKTYKNMSNASAFQKAMNEINDERLREYFESTMTAANNAVKIEAKTTNIRKKKANVQNVMVKLALSLPQESNWKESFLTKSHASKWHF